MSYAIRSVHHQSHRNEPTQLVFGRGMISPELTEVDWNTIKFQKQLRIKVSNDRKSSKQMPHTYAKGYYITLKKLGIIRKMTIPRNGTYKVVKYNNNNNGSLLIDTIMLYEDNISLIR